MDYFEKIKRMDEHLAEHPHDYQTVIARLKTASKAYESERNKLKSERLKRVAEIRKQLKEIDDGRM